MRNMRAIYTYTVLVLFFSILAYIAMQHTNINSLRALAMAYMWTPALSAVITYKLSKKSLKELFGKFSLKLYLIAPLLALVHYFLTLLILSEFCVCNRILRSLPGLLVLSYVAGVTGNALFALGEEIGWRGLMYLELKGSRLRKSLIIGTLWNIWHWPFIVTGVLNFPYSKALGMIPFEVFTVAVTYVMLILRELDGVWTTSSLHGTINAIGGLEFVSFTLPDYLRPPAGLLGGLAWVLIAIALYALSRRSSKALSKPNVSNKISQEVGMGTGSLFSLRA